MVGVVWEAGSFEGNGLIFKYCRTVPPKPLPPFVFLHGLTASGATLIPLLSELSDKFTIFVPDARGHGKSQPMPKGTFTADHLIEDTSSFIGHVSPSAPVVLAGHSMGAATAARVAKLHPEKVRALILEDPPWLRLPNEPVNPADRQPAPLAKCADLQALSEEEFNKLDEGVGDGSHHLTISMQKSERLFDVAGVEPNFRHTDDYLFNVAVEGLELPVLLQIGSVSSGSILKKELASQVLSTYAKGELQTYEGAPHVIHAHCPDNWLKQTREYLEKV